MSFWDFIPGGVHAQLPPQAAWGAAPEIPENLFVLSEIDSTMNPFINEPLEFTELALADSALALDYLENGEMAIYHNLIEDFVAMSLNEGDTVKLYYGISPLGPEGELGVSTDFDSNPVRITVTYTSAEREKLRDLFGQPENSTTASLIDDAVTAVSQTASGRGLDTRFKSNAVKTLAFTDADLTLLTDEEAAQGITLSMASAFTRVKPTTSPQPKTSTPAVATTTAAMGLTFGSGG